MDLYSFAQKLPKVELHVHFEGSILPITLLKLADRNHIPLKAQDEQGLSEIYHFRDFAQFIETYARVTSCLRTIEDYELVAYEFGRERARQNIRYSEVTFTILTNMENTGLPWQAILHGLNHGRRQAKKEFGVDWRWIFDIVRDQPETQDKVTDIALAARDDRQGSGGSETGVIALGLGGTEAAFPAELFIRSFERAYQAGLACVPHSGETAGPAAIWATIHNLHPVRLGHGVRCIEDLDLVEYLSRGRLPLEVCPSSNVCLGVFPDFSAHPLRKLWDAGVYITVNSDDPAMFGADLNHEYEILVDKFGFSAAELEQISLNGLHASLLSEEDKTILDEEFRQQFIQLHKNL
jgi:adenosine deaminase